MGSEDGEDPDLTHRDENSKGAAPRRSLPEADSIGIESFVRGLRLKTCTCCLRSFSERVAVRIVDVLESAVGPREEAPTIVASFRALLSFPWVISGQGGWGGDLRG